MGDSVITGKHLCDSLVCADVIYSVCVLADLPVCIFNSILNLPVSESKVTMARKSSRRCLSTVDEGCLLVHVCLFNIHVEWNYGPMGFQCGRSCYTIRVHREN